MEIVAVKDLLRSYSSLYFSETISLLPIRLVKLDSSTTLLDVSLRKHF